MRVIKKIVLVSVVRKGVFKPEPGIKKWYYCRICHKGILSAKVKLLPHQRGKLTVTIARIYES
jgi:hypothetical protein